MKLNFKAILYAAVAVLMTVSCEDGILDRSPNLGDVVADPVELTDVLFSDGERVKPYYQFSVKLGTAGATETSGVILDVKFVSTDLTLHAATYAPATAGNEHKNTYLTGANGTTLTVNGEVLSVVKGDIKVGLADGNYTLSGVVAANRTLEDGSVETLYYDLSWAGGALQFGDLPAMTRFTKAIKATSNVNSGINTVTVILATNDKITVADSYDAWPVVKKVWTGEGNALTIDFYSEKGYLEAGTYKPSADPANPKAGEYVIGGDLEGNAFGQAVTTENAGTCWWTIGETSTAQPITTGEIIVVQDEKNFIIDIDNGSTLASYVGELGNLAYIAPKEESITFTSMLSVSEQQFDQLGQVIIQLGTGDVKVNEDNSYSGTGKFLFMTINAAKDTDGNLYIPIGEYTVTTGASKPFTIEQTGGMDTPMGFFYWGTYLRDVVNGASEVTEIHEGTVTVSATTKAYTIEGAFGPIKIKYSGNLSTLVAPPDAIDDTPADGGEGEGEEGEGEGCGCDCDGCADCTGPGTGSGDEGDEGDEGDDSTKLTKFFAVTDYYKMFANSLVGVEVGTEGVTRTVEGWTTTYGGSGNYLKIEFYSADGKLAAGTYTASAENSPAEGEFGIGYDGQWGASGTTWYTVTDGELSYEYVTDGTAVVEVDGDTYTITIESSVVNATYTGPLSAPAAN